MASEIGGVLRELIAAFPKIDSGIELPEEVRGRLIVCPIEEMARQAETLFDRIPTQRTLESEEFQNFVLKGFSQIITSVLEAKKDFPPNTIVECGVNQAVFTHALDAKPIAATDSLATCVGVAGYASQNRAGFVIHIGSEADLDASKERLSEKMVAIAGSGPLQFHLRGGIVGESDALVEAIEKWIESLNRLFPAAIASREVLIRASLCDELGIPYTTSIRLDTRDGAIGIYDSCANFYAARSTERMSEEVFFRLAVELFVRKPEIKVVYFAPIGSKNDEIEDV